MDYTYYDRVHSTCVHMQHTAPKTKTAELDHQYLYLVAKCDIPISISAHFIKKKWVMKTFTSRRGLYVLIFLLILGWTVHVLYLHYNQEHDRNCSDQPSIPPPHQPNSTLTETGLDTTFRLLLGNPDIQKDSIVLEPTSGLPVKVTCTKWTLVKTNLGPGTYTLDGAVNPESQPFGDFESVLVVMDTVNLPFSTHHRPDQTRYRLVHAVIRANRVDATGLQTQTPSE